MRVVKRLIILLMDNHILKVIHQAKIDTIMVMNMLKRIILI